MKDNSDNQSIYRHGKANCQQTGCYKRARRIIKTSAKTSVILCEQHYKEIK